MQRILRSCLQVGNTPDAEECLSNWNRLQENGLGFPIEEDRKIHDYLKEFYGEMSAPPDFTLVRDFFEKRDDIETCARLDEVKKSQFHIRTNFLSIVRTELEGQQQRQLVLVCRDAATIAEHGMNIQKPGRDGKKVLRGTADAIGFVFDKMSEMTRFEGGEKLEGNISDDVEEVISEYERVESADAYMGRNIFGLEPLDQACEGHKTGEFHVHCAFPGELKSTLAINYAYNNAYLFGKKIFYAIFEMPYKQLRRQIYVLHSAHGKFITRWHSEDVKANRPNPYMGIDYRKVRDGKLDPLERKRFMEVAHDFHDTIKGHIYIWRPADHCGTSEVRRKAEMFHSKYGCDGIILDNIGNIKPAIRTNDFTTMMNSVVTECRFLALNFARGNTVPVLGLFHMNRQGKMRADKSDGRYDTAAISYANQLERDADVITYTYLNEQLRKDGKFYLGCLKNREGEVFDRMVGKIFWQSKRMRHIETGLLDLTTDQVVSISKQISMQADDLLT